MMLSAHTQISCPPEPWMLLFTSECFNIANVRKAPYGRNNAQIAALDFLQGLEYDKAGTLKDLAEKFAIGFKKKIDKECITRDLVQNVYSAQLSISGKAFFIDKTPRNYTILPFIDKYYPQSKKIFLKRNPLDIALSYLTTWNIPVKELAGKIITVNSRDFAEGLFVFSEYFSLSSPYKYIVAYEDLVKDCPLQLSEICKFIGVDFQPRMLKFFEDETIIQKFRESAVGDPISKKKTNTINTNSVGHGISRLARSDLESLLCLLGGNVFDNLGYSDVLSDLKRMGINIASEEAALYRRNGVIEKLFSKEFVEEERKILLGTHIEFVNRAIKNSEADRVAIAEQNETLTSMLKESEKDRAARAEQIETLTKMLKESEADRAARAEQIETLTKMLKESEADRAARAEQIETLTRMLKEFEAARVLH
jgi:hypothetical protein